MRIPANLRQHGPALLAAASTGKLGRGVRGLAWMRALRLLGIRGSVPLFLLILAAPRVRSLLARTLRRR